MYKYLRYYLLTLSFLLLTQAGYGQVELSALVGPAFNHASVNHAPDSAGTAPVKSDLTAGLATTLEANLPMQHGFRLKAGIRLMYRNLAFEQRYNYWGNKIKNQWFLEGISLETPVHLTYPVIDRRFQVMLGIGVAAVKNWINYGGAGISGYGTGTTTNTANTFYGNFTTSHYQPDKNSLSLAGELSAEITPAAFPRFSLGIVWHKDFLKQLGRLTYENQYGPAAISNQQLYFRSKGSFGVERPAYLLLQLKYTFAGNPKVTEREYNSDFEEDDFE